MNLANARTLLQQFDFTRLFVAELGWSNPSSAKSVPMVVKGIAFNRREVAQLSGVVVIEIVSDDGAIPDAAGRTAIHKELAKLYHENVLIFVDAKRSQSLWYWAKRQDRRLIPRTHIYVHGQSGDLLLSKLGAMAVDFADFDDSGHVPLLEVTARLKQALDIEQVTKKFYNDFKEQHVAFIELIEGIDDERDRRWYASVLLNRLMFIYFLQKKFFLDGGDEFYLQSKLAQCKKGGADRYYAHFLKPLFFEGFAKPEDKRTAEVNALLGKIKYLNGGLFLPHPVELRWPKIAVPDKAFENLLGLFGNYSWNLNDTPGGQDNEINPDVLGYIFEKYINQKAFGAYYTRPEITEYLCERTIHRLILDGVNGSGTGVPPVSSANHGHDAHATALNPLAPLSIRQGAYLPHWTQQGATYAVNFRLSDSLPAEVLKQWLAEREDIEKTARQMGHELSDADLDRLEQLHSEKVEKWLDAGHGACWLKDQRIARLVADALSHFDGQRYVLVAWCVMPNHVHVVFRPQAGHELPDILHSWKSFTSKEANKILKRSGEFWQAEYYDHLIRNENDFRKQVQYVLENPVKANLEGWKWVGCCGTGGGTGVSPVEDHGRDGHATKRHGRDARATFDSVGDLLLALDAPLCKKLLHEVLPSMRLLDPACGSAAFLVSAMKTLINVYAAVIGKIDFLSDRDLQAWLKKTQKEHKSVSYFIKRSIITNNLFGVDIMEEATEIAKLRLFLALVASAQNADDLEPLPNIEFNIMAGNSLVGLMHVDDAEFEKRHPADFFRKSYREVLEEKNELIEVYRRATTYGHDLQELRDNIQARKQAAVPALNDILLGEFVHLGIKYEEATLSGTGVSPVKDTAKMAVPRVKKRALTLADIAALKPFHWGYEFDQILGCGTGVPPVEEHGRDGHATRKRGGFDAIITNPPWEIFKPNAKEFFEEYSDLVTKKKMSVKDFEKEQTKLLKDEDTRAAWLKYQSEYPHVSAFYRSAPQYKNQISIVDGKKAGSDTNLYKLFTEQCFNLLRPGGYCGIVIPSGIYTDLGTKQLREMLFDHSRITGIFCIENRKEVFEGVHRSFKFVVLTFEKVDEASRLVAREMVDEASRLVQKTTKRDASSTMGTSRDGSSTFATTSFPAAFMRHDVAELERFPQEGSIEISVPLVRRLAPDSLSVMEFKSQMDVRIAEKMLKFPLLGERIEGAWNVAFTAEFHMTNDSRLFKTEPGKGRLPLYEGKMIWHFDHRFAENKWWVSETEGRAALKPRENGRYDYEYYRIGFRDVAASTNERTLIATVIPPRVFAGNTLPTLIEPTEPTAMAAIVALFDSLLADWFMRQRVTNHCNFFYMKQLPVPRLTEKDEAFRPIVERAARLICTTPEFDDLAKEIVDEPSRLVGTRRDAASTVRTSRDGSSTFGATDSAERAKLRAELDGLVAHLYGLTEDEFAYILTTFPLVPDAVKIAAHNAFRNVEKGLVQ